MKKLRMFVGIILALCLVACLTSCMKMDVGVTLEESGEASLTTKISIAKDLYEMMLSEETESDEDSPELSEFVEETIDGETYYSYSETKNYESYDKLVEDLLKLEVAEGMPLFKGLTVKGNDDGSYVFGAKIFEINTDLGATEGMEIPDDWLSFTMTVRMPGEIQKVVGGEKLEDGSVRFSLTDFTEEQSLSVISKVEPANPIKNIIIWVVGLAVIACVMVARFMPSKAKKGEPSDAKEDEEDVTEEE